jgi:hypothetical protein
MEAFLFYAELTVRQSFFQKFRHFGGSSRFPLRSEQAPELFEAASQPFLPEAKPTNILAYVVTATAGK